MDSHRGGDTADDPGSGADAAAVAEHFAAILALDEVGHDDDFFDLGGHSLLAVRLVARLREHEFMTLTVRDVFDAPTPNGLVNRAAGRPS